MRHLLAFSALAIFFAATSSAHADTIQTFNVSDATFASGATASGTVTIDTTLGTYVGLNFTYQLGAQQLLFTDVTGQSTDGTEYYFYSFNADGDILELGVPGTDLVGYGGSTICTTTNPCAGASGYVAPSGGSADSQTTGSLSANTPEPSSVLLLGTGLVCMVGVIRRKMPTA